MGRNPGVESVLTEKDFDQVWDYLEKKFGYSKAWRAECYEYVYGVHDYNSGPVWYFLFYCRRNLDPLLNAALCRNEYYPTFMRLLHWMFQDRIKKRQ